MSPNLFFLREYSHMVGSFSAFSSQCKPHSLARPSLNTDRNYSLSMPPLTSYSTLF